MNKSLNFALFALFSWTSLLADECLEKVESSPKTPMDFTELSPEELISIQVVSASRKVESWLDAPSSMTVFTRKQFEGMGVESVEELLNYVPGFLATREGVYGSGYRVAARGRTTPQASYNILFLMDGRRLNGDRSGGALDYNHSISLHNVQQVEIIRGPGSALYGTNAFSGVVNIITRNCDGPYREFYLGGGDLGRREGYFNWFQPGRNQQWEIGLSGRYFEEDGQDYVDFFHPGNTVHDPRGGRDLGVKARFRDLYLDFAYTQREQGDFFIDNFSSLREENDTDYHQYQANLEYRPWNEDRRELGFRLGFNHKESEIIVDTVAARAMRDILGDPDARGLLTGETGQEREWYAGFDLRYQLNQGHELFAGLEWRRPENVKNRALMNYSSNRLRALMFGVVDENVRYLGGLREVPLEITEEMSREILGVYFQDKFEINPQWVVTLGLRHDHYSDFGNTTNPRLALIYRPRELTRFKLLYGQAFRAPSFRQLGGFIGNRNLTPEKVKTYEAAWIQEFTPRDSLKGVFSLTWFGSRYSNMIDAVLTPEGVRQFTNLSGTTIARGWEMETGLRLSSRTSLRATYTHTLPVEAEPRQFPRHAASLVADYQRQNWYFNLNAFYHGAVEYARVDGIQTLPAYWVVNGAARYAIGPGLTLQFGVNNLLDKDYFASINAANYPEGMPNRGRHFRLGVNYRFR